MVDVLKLLAVLGFILLLLRLKWNVGYVLTTASGILAALYLMPVATAASTIISAAVDPVTVKLFLSLTLIRVLEIVLREQGVLANMTAAAKQILRNKKAVIISMPLLIGLLPSLGGAYFSAPMVEESTKGLRMSPEEKGFINYWYRHPWEYVLPLYPGVLLASAVTGIPLRSLILANATYAVVIFITGFLFSMKRVGGSFGRRQPPAETPSATSPRPAFPGSLIASFSPVILVLVLVIGLHVELHVALAITVTLLYLFFRSGIRDIGRTLKHGFALDVPILIFGTMLFKFTMENSGAVGRLSAYFTELGIPLLPVFVVLPFATGLLTGITVGFVGSTFPLLISLAGGAHLQQITLAFASGFIGVLLSPVHLCLVLTREYFKADMWGIYRKTIPACGIVMASAFAVYVAL
jgi:hypothetical protein